MQPLFTPAHGQFRLEGRHDVLARLAPRVDGWEAIEDLPREVMCDLGDAGLLGRTYPTDHGGLVAAYLRL